VRRDGLQRHIASWPGDIAKLPEERAKHWPKQEEHGKASVRAKVEHPFRVIKRPHSTTSRP
jgi:IS5 family transposase